MYRHPHGRNPRSKGNRGKNVLQNCLLLAVCFWLIYQVKHSHDKKKEFDENDAKASLRGVSKEIIKLGRKDINDKEEMVAKIEKHQEEETTGGEEVEEELSDKKTEEKEEEMGGTNDQIDENEPEKPDTEIDQEEDFIDDEKVRDEGDESEGEDGDSEDTDDQIDKGISLEDSDGDGDDRNEHEVREENYKADDASSAVTQDSGMLTAENENEGSLGSLNVSTDMNILEKEKKNNEEEISSGENRTEVQAESGELAKSEHQSSINVNETKAENGLSSNATVMEGSTERAKTINFREARTDVDFRDDNHNSTTENNNAKSGQREFPNSSNNTDLSASEKILKSEVSVEAGRTAESSTIKNYTNESQKFNPGEGSGGTEEAFDSRNENYKNVQHYSIHSSDSSTPSVESVVLRNPGTITDVQTEVTKTE